MPTKNDTIDCIVKEIRRRIRMSPIPEDPRHAENTLAWVLRLKPDASDTLKIAALGHDLERAELPRRLRKEDFTAYDAFKEAHARRSAELLEELMRSCGADEAFIREVSELVMRHETGGTPDADILNEADSLSFFETNIDQFFKREGWENTAARVRWGLKRLSDSSKQFLRGMKYGKRDLEILVESCMNTEKEG